VGCSHHYDDPLIQSATCHAESSVSGLVEINHPNADRLMDQKQ